MTQAIVRRALETALKAYADGASIPVAWENVEFAQPASGIYLRAFLLPLDVLSADIGRVNRRYEGILQVNIYGQTGTGAGAVEAIVSALSSAFDPAVPLTAAGLTVWVLEPLSPGPTLGERDRFVVPCSVRYAADTY